MDGAAFPRSLLVESTTSLYYHYLWKVFILYKVAVLVGKSKKFTVNNNA